MKKEKPLVNPPGLCRGRVCATCKNSIRANNGKKQTELVWCTEFDVFVSKYWNCDVYRQQREENNED